MDHVTWTERPDLRDPVLIVAFEGWNDAGDAATTAVGALAEAADTRPVASIDPEPYTDFAVNRPRVRLGADGTRRIEWPRISFAAGTLPGQQRDLVTLVAPEPRLRWRTYCQSVLAVATELGVGTIVSLGALLADVVHTAPVRIIGASSDPAATAHLTLRRSSYEGPTGIVGVLGHEAREAGFEVVSFWAPVPSYVPGANSPKAALALLRVLSSYLGVDAPEGELVVATEEYERAVDELVDGDDELTDYVRQLVLADDDDDGDGAPELPDSPGELVAEVERFLRDQKGPPGG